MRCINKVILIGNLTRNPEMRSTNSGQAVVTFGVATNREWATKEGDRKSSAEFHEVVAWGKLAEICETHLKKGQLVYLEGYLKTRSWETPEGVKKFKTEIVIKDMIRLQKDQNDRGGEDYYGDEDYEESAMPEENYGAPSVHETPFVDEQPTMASAPAAEEKEEKHDNLIDKDLGL